jgi:acetyl esterase/lipase
LTRFWPRLMMLGDTESILREAPTMASATLNYDPAAKLKFTTDDVVYRRDGANEWRALLYKPAGQGPFPAIIEIHGGAWNSGDRSNNPAIAEGLASSGVVVASIDFRMAGDRYPSSLQDINYGVRWLKSHARELNADSSSVGGLGVSSGGHLIVLSAMRPNDPRYAALPFEDASVDASLSYAISCWGVIDALGRYRLAQSDGRKELVANHDTYFVTEAAMAEGNPLMMLQRGEKSVMPPLLLVQGTADESLPKGMIQEFDERYRAAGGDSDLALFEDQPHGIAGWSAPAVEQMLERIKGFIAKQVGGKVTA